MNEQNQNEEIVRLFDAGMTYAALAKRFHKTRDAISGIVRRHRGAAQKRGRRPSAQVKATSMLFIDEDFDF